MVSFQVRKEEGVGGAGWFRGTDLGGRRSRWRVSQNLEYVRAGVGDGQGWSQFSVGLLMEVPGAEDSLVFGSLG